MKYYVVTSFIPGTEIDYRFWSSLETYRKRHDAEMIVLQCKENYKKDIKQPDDITEAFIDMAEKRGRHLNSNLRISTMKLNVNSIGPLSGLDPITNEGCVIMPFPRHTFRTVPRSLKHGEHPRCIWSTGTISEPYYKDTKAGMRVREWHVKGALVVAVENDKIFHIRQLQANEDGSFYDLLYLYKPEGYEKIDGVAGLSLGDLHPSQIDMGVMRANLDIMQKLNPKTVFYHDSFDAKTISHHDEHKKITKALNRTEIKTLQEEVRLTAACLNVHARTLPNSKHYIVKSNHDEHLDRYLNEFRFKDDPNNLLYSLKLAQYMVEYKMGTSPEDSLERALREEVDLPDNIIFLQRDDEISITPRRIEMSNHGDQGNNGARGNIKAQSLLFDGRVVVGHSHSPEISDMGGFCNGTCTPLSLPYCGPSGGSGWMNAHTIVYPSGTRTHIHVIRGSELNDAA